MKPARFVLVPLGAALAYGLAYALTPTSAHPLVVVGCVETLRIVAALACVLAARQYSAGDRLHGAWLLFALNLSLLLVKNVLFGKPLALAGTWAYATTARATLVIAGNLATVVAMALLAGAWRAAGLAAFVSPAKQWATAALAIALAAAATGWAAWVNVKLAAHGHPGAIEHVASDAGDFITFSLVAPLALVTLALRGGTLFWAWLFVVLSKLGWLAFDVVLGIGETTGASDRLKPWLELLRVLALAWMAAAGLAQRAGASRD